ncbi:MAG: adenosylcobalamin-dependent ribonucleoside-diphosphate reductase [Nitrospiraceae bacterium]
MPTRRPTVPHLSSNARTVLQRRYLMKNERGRLIETPAQMFSRVATNIAGAERGYRVQMPPARVARSFYEMMAKLEFLPNSPTLMNAGGRLQQLSACFVLPVADSLESIYETLKHQALIHQSGGGTGFSFSRLRPKDDVVATTHGIASGPVSFMRIFNTSTDVIKQGGTRRGANMGILRVDHPDILEFIQAKQRPEALTNFNISVGVTDAFMEAVARRRDYPLINPRTNRLVRRISAQMVFDTLIDAAWTSGEPGIIFLDTINRTQPTPTVGEIEATNPCGEQPLLPYESCVLGSINLAKFVDGPLQTRHIDYERLAERVRLAVRFLDNVIDMTRFPLEAIARLTTGNRKIGLGVMGFADLLISLNVPYDSEEALKLGESLMRFVREHAHEASGDLARTRGVFPNYGTSRLKETGERRRNATVTTIAPTGTISIIADCSAGIEPLYGVSFVRTVMDDVRLTSVHPEFLRLARRHGIASDALLRKVSQQESIQHLTEIPPDLRRLFVTAHDVSPEHHVRIQAAFQKYSDSGVSKTINLPTGASRADVAGAFRLAYQLGCKGLTVFRNGSRERQVLSCANIQYC